MALDLAQRAGSLGQTEARALSLRAAAVAARSRDVGEARRLAQAALDAAQEGGLDDTAARVRVTAAGIEVFAGRHAIARSALEDVAARSGGRARWEALAQLGFLHLLAGEYQQAIDALDDARQHLPTGGVWLANALSNRGLAHGYAGQLDLATSDLEAAIDVFRSLGADLAVAEARQNLGWVRDQAGDSVGAIRAYAEAERLLADTPAARGYLLRDRANTLLAVGLATDAADSARRSADEFRRAGRDGDAADSMVAEATALAVAGIHAAAVRVADEARRRFDAQSRPIHAAHAELITLRAVPPADAAPEMAVRAAALASRLEEQGAVNVAIEARLTAARLALWTGDKQRAAHELDEASRAERSPRHDLRIGYWEVAAELAALQDQPDVALERAGRGLAVLEDSQRTLGATEARVNISATARRVGSVAMRVARDRDAETMFDWTERVRAGSLRFRPVRPDGDQGLAEDRLRLRTLATEIDVGQLEGREVSHLIRESQELERSIRMRLLEARGTEPGVERATANRVGEIIGDAVMVAYAGVGDRLVSVRLDRRGAALYDLGPSAPVRDEVDHLRLSALRLTTGRPSGPSTPDPSTLRALQEGAKRLDDLVLGPVDQTDRVLVVVPMGAMFTVPWALLPTAVARPTVVTPSASMWLASVGSPSTTGQRRVLAAGPGLAHAGDEIGALARLHPEALVLSATGSTSGAVLGAIDGADLFHIACHGVFRADNPLFSHLQVADGPLAVHELETLDRAPTTVILSSCDVGLTQPRPGNEWLGMATALLTLGTRSLIASVMPVPDTRATVGLMERVHSGLRAGASAGEALHAAAAALDSDDPFELAARAAFSCIGA